MRDVWAVCYFAVFLFLVLLIGRFILELIQNFARDWRPRGVVLVIAEVVYTVTDPPLRLLRRLIPAIRIGGMSLDVGFLILFVLTGFVLKIFGSLANT